MSPTLSFQLFPSTRAPSVARGTSESSSPRTALPTATRATSQFTSSLLTSELVTHAMDARWSGRRRHGPRAVDLAEHTLRAELSLDDVALPIDVAPSGDRQIVCGLAIIDSLARRWGGDHTGRGTCLWFELDAGRP